MKRTKVVYPHKSLVNIYIVYKLDDFNNKNNLNIRKDPTNPDQTARNCLFGAVKVTKITQIILTTNTLVMEFVLMEKVILPMVILRVVEM